MGKKKDALALAGAQPMVFPSAMPGKKQKKRDRNNGGMVIMGSTLKQGAETTLTRVGGIVAVHKLTMPMYEDAAKGKEGSAANEAKRNFALKQLAAGYFLTRTFESGGLGDAGAQGLIASGAVRLAETL